MTSAIYMGGGTPTVLTESELDELLTHIALAAMVKSV